METLVVWLGRWIDLRHLNVVVNSRIRSSFTNHDSIFGVGIMASRLESDIRAVKKGLVNGIEDSIAEMALSVFSSVVIATPVGNPTLWLSNPPRGYVGGRARGNWQPSFGSPATSALITTDKGGQTTISKGNGLFARYEFGEKIFITNNLAYIQRLNEGHSRQAPSGFVQKAIMAGIANLDRKRIDF